MDDGIEIILSLIGSFDSGEYAHTKCRHLFLDQGGNLKIEVTW
jgi:hypothetical protein